MTCNSWLLGTAFGQSPPTDTVAPDTPGVVAKGTTVLVIGTGFQGTERPIGLPDGTFLFTETVANRITKIDESDNASAFLENTNGSNGLAIDLKGRVIAVQTGPRRTKVGVIYPRGSEAVLADNFEGKPFGRPNDLVVDRKGAVYFTDPGQNSGPKSPLAALPPAVYYIPSGKDAVRVAEDIEWPNRVQLSRDETVLYVSNTAGEYLLAFDVQPDGTLRNRRHFARHQKIRRSKGRVRSGADGIAMDNEGGVYVATARGN